MCRGRHGYARGGPPLYDGAAPFDSPGYAALIAGLYEGKDAFPFDPFPGATASPIPGEDAVPLDPLPATPRSSRDSMRKLRLRGSPAAHTLRRRPFSPRPPRSGGARRASGWRLGTTPGKPAASRAAALNETRGTGAPSHNGPIMRPVAAAAPTVPLAVRPSPSRRKRFRRIPADTRRRSADPRAPCQGEGAALRAGLAKRAFDSVSPLRLSLHPALRRPEDADRRSDGPRPALDFPSSAPPAGKRPSRWLPDALVRHSLEGDGGRLLRRPHHAARERRGIMVRRPRSSRRRERRRRLRHRRRSLFAALASRNALRAGPAGIVAGTNAALWRPLAGPPRRPRERHRPSLRFAVSGVPRFIGRLPWRRRPLVVSLRSGGSRLRRARRPVRLSPRRRHGGATRAPRRPGPACPP